MTLLNSLFPGPVMAVLMVLLSVKSLCAVPALVADRSYYDTPTVVRDSAVGMWLPLGANSCLIEVRAAIGDVSAKPGMADNYWGVRLCAPTDTVVVQLRHGNTSFGDIYDKRQSLLTVSCNGSGEIGNVDYGGFSAASGDYNSIHLLVDMESNCLRISGGGKRIDDIVNVDMADELKPDRAEVWCKGVLEVSMFAVEGSKTHQNEYSTIWDEESLATHIRQSKDAVEGYWRYLDRENNPQYARLGGEYTLGVVKTESGCYDIVYVSGARTLAGEWKPMMLKGRLKPTIFIGHYDLEWVDSTFERIDRDVHAQITDGVILTLSFPLLKTTLRFSKMEIK